MKTYCVVCCKPSKGLHMCTPCREKNYPTEEEEGIMEQVLARPKSELAGKAVTLKLRTVNHQDIDGKEFNVEDWYQNVNRDSRTEWRNCETWAERNYAERIASSEIPFDNDVLYGKVGRFGYLIHVTEIGE